MKKYLFIIIMILLIPELVYSNSGPPIIDPIDQSIVFDSHSKVSLVEEWVTITFQDKEFDGSKKLDLRTGHVSVKYILKNLDNKEKNLDLLFISPQINSSNITIMKNDKKINGIEYEEDLIPPENWNPKTTKEIIEPFSIKNLYNIPNSIYYPNYKFSGIKFNINFKPNEILTLNINYESPSGFYRGNVASMVYSQIYYLTPASFWEGDSKVNLKVQFPKSSKIKLYSNITLSKTNNYTYEGTLDRIPEKEWIFTFVDSSRLIFGTNDRTVHNSLVFIITFTGFIAGLFLRKKSYKIYGFMTWLFSILFLIYIFKPTYGFMFLLYIFGPWALLGLIVILGIVYYQKK